MKKLLIIFAISLSLQGFSQSCSFDTVKQSGEYMTEIQITTPIKESISIEKRTFKPKKEPGKTVYFITLNIIEKSDPTAMGVIILFEDGTLINKADAIVKQTSYDPVNGYKVNSTFNITDVELDMIRTKKIKGIGQTVHELTSVDATTIIQYMKCLSN